MARTTMTIVSCAVLTAACGARLSKEQMAVATAGDASGRVGVASATPAGEAGTPDPTPVVTTATAAADVAAAPATRPPGTPAAAGKPGVTVTTTAPVSTTTGASADNGGSTDIGVTGNSILLGNISTLTGPIPGLFAGAANGTQAFLAYQNSVGGVFGRQLKLKAGDDRFDCATNRATTEQYIGQVFAFVASFSTFDGCAAPIFAGKPELADVHTALALDAQKVTNNFSPAPVKPGISLGVVNYIKQHYPDSINSVASLEGDVQATKDSWAGAKKVMEANGLKFTYERLYSPTETDFTADVVQMRSKGIKLVIEVAADAKTVARLQNAAQQQNWKPDAWIGGGSVYDLACLSLAGASGEGTLVYSSAAMYLGEDRGRVPEVDLFQTWMKKTHPEASADLFAAYGWASGRLFVQALQAAGPKATRASLLTALRSVHAYEANGFLAKSDPAGKGPSSCFLIIQVKGGKFTRVEPSNGYKCDGPYGSA